MGFNKKARKEATAQQQAMFAQQQKAYTDSQNAFNAYNSNFDKRNASIISLRDRGSNFLDRYSKGTDISELIPSSVKTGQMASDTVKNTIQAAGGIGDSSQLPKDAGYQQKLNSVMGANMARGLAQVNEAALQGEVGQQTENVFNASQFLNADAGTGLNLNNQIFNMSNTLWQNATTRRQMEIDVSNQAFGKMMQGLQFGVGIASGGLGAGGMFGAGGAFGSRSSGGSGVYSGSSNGGGNPFSRYISGY